MEAVEYGYLNNTYEIVSKVGFLIGIRKEIFETSSLDLEWYKIISQDRAARIIRNLCILRTDLLRRYKKIEDEIAVNKKNLDSMSELINQAAIRSLKNDGINIIHDDWDRKRYLVYINSKIKNYIYLCQRWFPIWLKWEYIRDAITVSDEQTEDYYIKHVEYFPYQMYLCINLTKYGNILYNDKKFVTILYKIFGDRFADTSKVSDASNNTRISIHNFIAQSKRAAIVVDCENADPYKLYSMLSTLPANDSDKIIKIILYNDIHTSDVWKILNRFLDVSIEHQMIKRIKENKSLVDIKLTAGTCREYYNNQIESFILVSSDSDFWGLITSMHECRFMTLIEYEKCSSVIVEAMKEKNIPYCYLDDFCSSNLENLQAEILLTEIRSYLKNSKISIDALLNRAIKNTRVNLTAEELEQFKRKYLNKIKLVVDNKSITIDFENS